MPLNSGQYDKTVRSLKTYVSIWKKNKIGSYSPKMKKKNPYIFTDTKNLPPERRICRNNFRIKLPENKQKKKMG